MKDGGLCEVTTNTINSILIHKDDDVATAIADLNRGEVAQYVKEGEIVRVEIAEHIPQYHKLAVRNIRRAERIRKYGQVIGEATQDIRQGGHVHLHNIVSPAGER
jgi:hypothetical protein